MMISVLCIVLVALCLLVGGDRTAKTLMTLSLNAIVLVAVIWAISLGLPPMIVSIAAILIVICITIFYQNEVNDKTRVAFIAVIVIAAVMLALIAVFVYGGHLQGMSFVGENKIRQSNGYSGDIGVDMFAIAILVMLWTLVGAIVDTAMAIVSGVYEIARQYFKFHRKYVILHICRRIFDFIYQFQHVLFTGSHDKFKRVCRGDHKYYYQCGGMYRDHTGSVLPGSVSIQ